MKIHNLDGTFVNSLIDSIDDFNYEYGLTIDGFQDYKLMYIAGGEL